MAIFRKLAPTCEVLAAQLGFDRFDVVLHAMVPKVFNRLLSRKLFGNSKRIAPLRRARTIDGWQSVQRATELLEVEAFFTLQSYSDWFCAVQDIPLLLLPIRF